jgi:hypothetical protein
LENIGEGDGDSEADGEDGTAKLVVADSTGREQGFVVESFAISSS